MVIATHVGYFRYKCLPFGVHFAPVLFQTMIDKVLIGLSQTAGFIDDIVVAGKTPQEHMTLIQEVFSGLKHMNIRIKKVKC